MLGAPFQPFPDPGKKRGFIARLAARILRTLVKEDVSTFPQPVGKTTEVGAGEAAFQSFQNTYWKIHWDRRAVYNDLREMDMNDPLISTALDIIADCATGYEDTAVDAFTWLMDRSTDGSVKAMAILNEMKLRLDLGTDCWQLVRKFVQYGEEFREIVWDEDGIARNFKHLPSYQIYPRLDGFGNKLPGWEQRLDGAQYGRPIQLPEWTVIPFVYGAKRMNWQGTGLMLPARRTWKRLTKMEDGMAIARILRAYDKLVHKVPVKPDWDLDRLTRAIQEYKRNMTRRPGLDEVDQLFMRERPLQPETDFYLWDDGSNRGGVEILTAQNQQLMNIDDVLYHQALLMARLKVPAKYLNLVRKSGALTDAGLSAEDIQFARTLRQVQAVLRSGLVRLAHYALAFQGYDSDALGVGVDLPKISTDDQYQDARIRFTMAQAASLFSEIFGGLPPEIVAEKFMDLDDVEKEVLFAWLKDKEAEEAREEALMAKLNPDGTLPPDAPQTRDMRGRYRDEAALGARLAARGSGKGGVKRNSPVGLATQPDEDAGSDGDAGANDQGVPFGLVVEALTTLQMACQSALEKDGVKFNLGHAERRARTREQLAEACAMNGASPHV